HPEPPGARRTVSRYLADRRRQGAALRRAGGLRRAQGRPADGHRPGQAGGDLSARPARSDRAEPSIVRTPAPPIRPRRGPPVRPALSSLAPQEADAGRGRMTLFWRTMAGGVTLLERLTNASHTRTADLQRPERPPEPSPG